MPHSGVLMVAGAIAALELLARSPVAFDAPGPVLLAAVALCAYRDGLRPALVAAAASLAYLVYLALSPPGDPLPLAHLALSALAIPAVAAATGTLRDRLGATETRNRRILESVTDGFVMLDNEWRFSYVNQAAEGILRQSREELLGGDAREGFPKALYNEFYEGYRQAVTEQRPIRFEGSLPSGAWLEVHAYPSEDGLAVYFRDVTARREHEEKLRTMTLIDELTGLYNRRGFFTLAERQWKLAERYQRGLLLIFADLDDLKTINDTHGHNVGDQALFEAAAVLRHTFRETDVVARIGGDEFAALVLETEPEITPHLLERLRTSLEQTNAQETLPFALSISYGVAGFPADAPVPIGDLLSLADHRMYEQKRAKRG